MIASSDSYEEDEQIILTCVVTGGDGSESSISWEQDNIPLDGQNSLELTLNATIEMNESEFTCSTGGVQSMPLPISVSQGNAKKNVS